MLTVRDAMNGGHLISQDDHIIGVAALPLLAPLLADQHPHHVWLPLQHPPARKRCFCSVFLFFIFCNSYKCMDMV